jgi:hypothetical protein
VQPAFEPHRSLSAELGQLDAAPGAPEVPAAALAFELAHHPPFTRDGAVDYPAIQRLGRWLSSVNGVKSLTVLGHAGEALSSSVTSRSRYIEAFRESVVSVWPSHLA